MSHVDLDALLADEEPGEPNSFTFRGQEWLLPVHPPIEVVSKTDGLVIWQILIEEGAAGQLERFTALRPRVTDREMKVLDKALGRIYGATVGESSASVEPSVITGARSRQTSNGSTGSTSDVVHGPEAEYRA